MASHGKWVDNEGWKAGKQYGNQEGRIGSDGKMDEWRKGKRDGKRESSMASRKEG